MAAAARAVCLRPNRMAVQERFAVMPAEGRIGLDDVVKAAPVILAERDGLVENSRVMGERLKAGLNNLKRLAIVGDVRGLGLFCAVELVSDKRTRAPLPKEIVPRCRCS